jgi:hypothetical protein
MFILKKHNRKNKKGNNEKKYGSPTRSDGHLGDWSLVRDQAIF